MRFERLDGRGRRRGLLLNGFDLRIRGFVDGRSLGGVRLRSGGRAAGGRGIEVG